MRPAVAYLGLLLCLAGCSGKPAADDGDKKTVVAVDLLTCKTGSVDDYLDLDGSFETGQGGLTKLSPGVQGRVKAVYVHEGDRVKKGQLLARLDPAVQEAQIGSAQAALQSAQVQYDQSQIQLSASKADQANNLSSATIALEQAKSEGQNSIDQAQFALDQSEADLAKLKNGARPLEIAQAHEATVQANATLQRAKTELDRDEALWPQGYIAKKQLDDARTSVETANSAYNAAQDAEQLVKAGARPEELRAATSKVQSAQQALSSARKLAHDQVLAAQTTYDHAKTGVLAVTSKARDVANSAALEKQKAADLATSQAVSQQLEIRAPFDGKVLKRSAAVGDPADPATALFVVQSEGSQIDFVATGLPGQILEINPGMHAQVEAAGKSYSGIVVSTAPPDAAGNLSSVRISMEGMPTPGAFGVAHVRLKKLSDVVIVPDTAVVQKDGKDVVFKNANGTAKQTEVKVGPSSGGSTAILSGLKPGDSIVASGGNELDDGTAISATKDKPDKDDGDKG